MEGVKMAFSKGTASGLLLNIMKLQSDKPRNSETCCTGYF
jgi:hypothetical protein